MKWSLAIVALSLIVGCQSRNHVENDYWEKEINSEWYARARQIESGNPKIGTIYYVGEADVDCADDGKLWRGKIVGQIVIKPKTGVLIHSHHVEIEGDSLKLKSGANSLLIESEQSSSSDR